MPDPSDIVPYHDPHDPIIPYGEHLLQYFQTHNPTLSDLTRPNISLPPTIYIQSGQLPPPQVPAECTPDPASAPPPTPAVITTAGEARPPDRFDDRALWSFAQGANIAKTCDSTDDASASAGSSNGSDTPMGNIEVGNTLAGRSGTVTDHCYMPVGDSEEMDFIGKDVAGINFKRPVVILPETPPTYSCTCCHVLRHITHTDGNHTAKLELHGRVGIISHGILENSYYHGMPSRSKPYEMFDFTKRSLGEVKEFLQQYMDERRLGRYIMLEDPLTPYYEAICVVLMEDPLNSEDFFDEATDSDGDEVNQVPAAAQPQPKKSSSRQKPSLAEQRERAAMMSVLDIAAYFHMPIENASKRLMLCPTVVKKICRRGGVRRWPYRKVKSLDNKIMRLSTKFEMLNSEEKASMQAQIHSRGSRFRAMYRITRYTSQSTIRRDVPTEMSLDLGRYRKKGMKYEWKTEIGTYLPDRKSSVISSIPFMPSHDKHMGVEAITARCMAWFSAATSSGSPLVFVNVQTEQIISSGRSISMGKENSTEMQRQQQQQRQTLQVVQGVRLWFLPGLSEMLLELVPMPHETWFRMDIKLTEEVRIIALIEMA
ncbi:hypothetical protein MLD38_006491 [Melastoma candidum]|uniref:Uncharacterized protein n=1 Tax=Melastoma candidum TaxID=119954 RepID=A0ACB9RRT8_9MYRT|nr:hypothetical protein MLD38_006491 [Melastoma candidum]